MSADDFDRCDTLTVVEKKLAESKKSSKTLIQVDSAQEKKLNEI